MFLRYLDYFRESVVAKVSALTEDDVRRSLLPSGWTPLELVKHLRHVELRWIEWGFQGRDVGDPWGDRREDRWYVAPEETRQGLLAALRAQGSRTRAVAELAGGPTDEQPPCVACFGIDRDAPVPAAGRVRLGAYLHPAEPTELVRRPPCRCPRRPGSAHRLLPALDLGKRDPGGWS
ncbi:DUF664 domain-containing protein [Micromonospora sp. KC606]|uniref:mycothiol transferase n=1 Tax=Micromonospora sp. KC606 TaxID=2530379 RepID=UPI001FB7F4D7|nr:DUF664 domain-containing protein [Micromonospora sp. KC606]